VSDVADELQSEAQDGLPPPSSRAARPKGCVAHLDDDLMVCARCGLDWPSGDIGPACDPITFDRLRRRMVSEVTGAEASLTNVYLLRREGKPADTAPARRRLAELDALSRLIDRATSDPRIKEILNGKK
jgi:hypothetical protein